MVDYFQILCGIAVVLLSLYYYLRKTYDFWKNLGVPGPRPSLFYGNLITVMTKETSVGDMIKNFYDKYKHEPLFGIFLRREPILIVNDLELIKDVLIKDFPIFASRGIRIFPKAEPLSEHLFSLSPEIWRPLRIRLTPVFTSGKLKEMFSLIVECAENLEKYLENVHGKEEPVECIDLAAKFTTDVIGSCAFGINMNSLSEKDSEFRRMGKEIFQPSTKQKIRDISKEFMPDLYSVIGHLLQNRELNEFFINVITDTIDYRKKANVSRPDFVNALIDIKENPKKLDNIELSDTFLTAQAVLFFIAGFETSSTTISNALYELALHPDMQDRLRNEIKESCAKHGRVVTYEQLKEMKYLDKVFQETLRMHSIFPFLMREASQSYTFRNTKITIPAYTKIWIPIYGIHSDPELYPNPHLFNPERFNDDVVAARHPMSYLPFGDGPRNCIGIRFAHLQSKVGLITILRDYKVDVCEKTTIPYELDPSYFLLRCKGGVMLKLTKVEAT